MSSHVVVALVLSQVAKPGAPPLPHAQPPAPDGRGLATSVASRTGRT